MYHCQGICNRQEQGNHFFLADPSPMGCHIFLKIHSFQIFHHKISRMILVEKFIDGYNIGITVKPGNGFRFFKEFLRTFLEQIFLLPAVYCQRILPRLSRRQAVRQILLDGHLPVSGNVEPKIGDPKSAPAQCFSDQIFSRQDLSHRKRAGICRIIFLSQAA